MKPLISIIIPTCNDFQKLLKPCLDSIERYTNLQNIEIIIVNNAIPKEQYLFAGLDSSIIKLISYPQPMGYPFAVNRGIEIAQGKFILLLNNDVPENDIILITKDEKHQEDIKEGNFKRIIIVSPSITYGVNINGDEYDYIFCHYENRTIDYCE